jgi:AcrR family transcriptional regulator
MAVNGKYLPAEERRAVIVETVLALAAEGNPSEITTAAIAERMGLTQGALFRHFQNKDAIWEAVMAWAARTLAMRLEAAATAARTPLEALEAVFFAHIGFITEYPGVPGIFFGELQRPGYSPARERARELMEGYGARLRAILREGQAGGQLSSAFDPGAAASLFVGIIQGLVLQSFLSGSRETVSKNAPAAFSLFRRGIEAGDAP